MSIICERCSGLMVKSRLYVGSDIKKEGGEIDVKDIFVDLYICPKCDKSKEKKDGLQERC